MKFHINQKWEYLFKFILLIQWVFVNILWKLMWNKNSMLLFKPVLKFINKCFDDFWFKIMQRYQHEKNTCLLECVQLLVLF